MYRKDNNENIEKINFCAEVKTIPNLHQPSTFTRSFSNLILGGNNDTGELYSNKGSS